MQAGREIYRLFCFRLFCIFAAYHTPSVTQHYLKASINFGAFLLNNLHGNVFFVGLQYILIRWCL